jgi:glycosyltransferase involved in cell wall biosynthesis
VRVVALDVSLNRLDGGGKRVGAFIGALRAGGFEVEEIAIGPRGIDGTQKVVKSRLHRAKRRLLPVQLRGRVEAELAGLDNSGPTLSLVPSANRWAVKSKPNWLDFPDLWSNVARNNARTVDFISAGSNIAQARLWARREAEEYDRADVVSVASWSDRQQMGERAVWLPTPVAQSASMLRRRRRSSSQSRVVYGMIANFDYPPNRDAYDRLIRVWLPALLPSAQRVVVAGFGSENLPRVGNVDIIGPVDDVATFYEQVDVVIAPTELGGGMKVKVVESMMYGVPVVTSEHARSGLPDAIAEECVTWGRLSSELQDPTFRSRFPDPRDKAIVAEALESFTLRSFTTVFNKIWRERMINHK